MEWKFVINLKCFIVPWTFFWGRFSTWEVKVSYVKQERFALSFSELLNNFSSLVVIAACLPALSSDSFSARPPN